jgi:hypothetical protein
MNAQNEAVEIVARVIYEANPWQAGPVSRLRDMTWVEMVEEDEAEPFRVNARAAIAALDAAGFLATETEWGVKHSQGTRPETSLQSAEQWSDKANVRNAHRFDYESRHKTKVVLRRLTPWRDA